LKNRKYSYIC